MPPGRRVAATGALSLAALVCSSCTAASTPIVPEDALARQLTELTAPLACETAYPLYDDVYHEASMRGTICVDAKGSISQLRVYDSSVATVAALQDWAIDPGNQWLLQESNWFAIGPRTQIDMVASHAQLQAPPTQDLPHLPPNYAPDPLDECVQFVSSTATTFLTDRSMFSADKAAMNNVVSGVTAEVESLMQQPDAATLRSLSPDDLAFESEFSRLGPDIKTFCRDHRSASPN